MLTSCSFSSVSLPLMRRVFAKYLTFVGRELQVNITHLQFHKGQRSAFIKNKVWMEQRVGFSPSLYDPPEVVVMIEVFLPPYRWGSVRIKTAELK